MDDLEKLRQIKYRRSAKTLLDLSKKVQLILKNEHLPADLGIKHDHYLWEEH